MQYFTLDELTHSDTAVSLGIDNTPTPEALCNLKTLIDYVLNPLRERWGLPIRVNSGYRCPLLNEEVNGREGSYHIDGCAADITAIAVGEDDRRHRNIELMGLIRTMHCMEHIDLTECYAGPDYGYIHIAYKAGDIDEFPFI